MLDFAEQWRHDEELQRGGVILRYHIPFTGEREWARTYKVALREINAHAIVNAGLRVRFAGRRHRRRGRARCSAGSARSRSTPPGWNGC